MGCEEKTSPKSVIGALKALKANELSAFLWDSLERIYLKINELLEVIEG
jgi:hypothetical protein